MRQSTYLKKVLKALEVAGWWIKAVDDGEAPEKFADTVPLSKRIGLTMEAVKAVEDATIYVSNSEKTCAIRVVWQGDDATYEEGEEVICDYSMSLDSIISTVETE